MLEVLSSAKDPEATTFMLKGLRRLHSSEQVGMHHIEAIAKTRTAAAASYLFALYHDAELDRDFRDTAFNAALEILEQPTIGGDHGELPEDLLKLMGGSNPQDRWIAAVGLVRLTGADHLPAILERFKDDGVYRNAEEDPEKSIADLCLDIFDQGHGEKAKGVFMTQLRGPNPVARAISITCLKDNEAFMAKSAIQAMVKPPEDPLDVSLASFLGPAYTLGTLAQNAVDGLAMLEQTAADKKAGKLNPVEAYQKGLIIKFEMKSTGDAYRQVVAQRYADWQADYKADPSKFSAGPGE